MTYYAHTISFLPSPDMAFQTRVNTFSIESWWQFV